MGGWTLASRHSEILQYIASIRLNVERALIRIFASDGAHLGTHVHVDSDDAILYFLI